MKTINRKSMLYKTKVDYQLGEDGEPINDYAMNHVLGCSHGCKYPCYAYLMAKRFGQVESYEEWSDPKPVSNTLELLEKELATKKDVRRVHLCFTTDPLPEPFYEGIPLERQTANLKIRKATVEAVRLINGHGVPVTLLTKSYYGSAFAWQGAHPDNYYGISLVSLSEGFRERWEPGAAPYSERVEPLKALHDLGHKTWVSMEPFPALAPWDYEEVYGEGEEFGVHPTVGRHNLAEFMNLCDVGDIDDVMPVELARRECENNHDPYGALYAVLASVHFVDRIVFGRWNYNKEMPRGDLDPASWYPAAETIVESWCEERGIECVVKKNSQPKGKESAR